VTDFANLCPGCFSEKPQGPVCPRCGYDEERERLPPLCLPRRTVLRDQYVIGKPLGRPGGFGITYLAWDIALEIPVAIKEYLPRDLGGRRNGSLAVESHSAEDEVAFRYGIEQFRKEARTLARLDHPNIMRVRSFFEGTGTAYIVMDYYKGQSLPQLLAGRGGRLPEEEAVALLLPILDALGYLHAQGLLHRDVKPANLYLKADGTPILLDFGAARSALGERTMTLSVLLSPGYAPFEQYSSSGQQGPWTDVYSAAATLYRLVSGEAPPDANGRMEKDRLVPPDQLVPGLSPRLCKALLLGLAPRRQGRLQSASQLRQLLIAAPRGGTAANSSGDAPREKVPSKPGLSRSISKTTFGSAPTTKKKLFEPKKHLTLVILALLLIILTTAIVVTLKFKTASRSPSEVAADLELGLKTRNVVLIRDSFQEAAKLPPFALPIEADLASARSSAELYKRAKAAADQGDAAETLKCFDLISKLLSGGKGTVAQLQDPSGLLDHAATALEAEARSLLSQARPDQAAARLEPLSRIWPERYNKVFQQFDKSPPAINLRYGYQLDYDRGNPVSLSFRITDDFKVNDVKIFARPAGSGRLQEIPYVREGYIYTATIEPTFHQNQTIEFYVVATDLSGNQGFLGTSDKPLQVRRRKGFRSLQ
jgi:serine/threonine protein kinase